MMGSLLERPLIKKDFNGKYNQIVKLLNQEIDAIKMIYDKEMKILKETGHITVHKFMPQVSGSLKWAQELRDRIGSSIGSFKHLEHE